MARKKLTWVKFVPRFWEGVEIAGLIADPKEAFLTLEVVAPDNQNNREVLRTRFYHASHVPSDEFAPYNVRHDNYRRHTAYDPNDPFSDSEVETVWVHSERFAVYELERTPGALYAATTTDRMKDVFRRYREFAKDESAVLNDRVLNIQSFEKTLVDAEVVGYVLKQVSGTPFSYDRVHMEGAQIAQNSEAQGLVRRAGQMKMLTVELQSGISILRLEVRDDGSITFLNYPGDSIALDVINKLEPLIDGCSDMKLVHVGQRR